MHHCSLDKNPKIVQVIYQKSRECLTMISKHEKAYEAQGAKPRELYIVFECFHIMGKHEHKYLIYILTLINYSRINSINAQSDENSK